MQSLQPLSISPDRLSTAINKLLTADRSRFARLWAYYQNPMQPLDTQSNDKPYRQAQEWGLPTRITGFRSRGDLLASQQDEQAQRKEVVIENDIAWRIETMAEYLFGKPLILASAAPDADRRAILTELLRQIIAINGGMILFQQLALLASVYGFVDVLVKLDLAKLHDLPRTTPPRPWHFSATANDANRIATEVARPDREPPCGDTQSLGRPPMDAPNDASHATSDSLTHPPQALAPATEPSTPATDSPTSSCDTVSTNPAPTLAQLAGLIRFETIEPARALPLVASDDYRVVEAYGQVFELTTYDKPADNASHQRAWLDRIYAAAKNAIRPPVISFGGATAPRKVQVVELLTSDAWQRYEDNKLIASGVNSLGQIPLVHIQNIALPFEYAGASDVEPLIPLQDELNTRLSDRASRITLQSFKMYLGKNIDDFLDMPVGPGRMWATDNKDAQVFEFGGDSANPSEESHIAEIREAMDKTSGVSPVASGGVKNKLGHLTSAAALRVTMQSLLSKTEKKRITFNLAIARLCELSLAWLDAAGVFRTTPDERRVELHWANPLPLSDQDELDEAKAKIDLGVPREVVLRELGY